MSRIWCKNSPFDSLLIKYWSDTNFDELIKQWSTEDKTDIINFLFPNLRLPNIIDYNYFVNKLKELRKRKNICDEFKFCQDVQSHSINMACVTAAVLRKRLDDNNNILGYWNDSSIQNNVMERLGNFKRQKIGVLLYRIPNKLDNSCPCQSDCDDVIQHIHKVIYDNFYLYTVSNDTHLIDNNREQYEQKVRKQIYRVADCIVILVNKVMIDSWNTDNDMLTNTWLRTLASPLQIRIIIISPCAESDQGLSSIRKTLSEVNPVGLSSNSINIAPYSSIVSLIKRACNRGPMKTTKKYLQRSLNVMHLYGYNSTQ